MRKVEEEMVLAIEFFARNGYNASPKNIKCSANTEVIWSPVPACNIEFSVSIEVYFYQKKALTFAVKGKELVAVEYDPDFWNVNHTNLSRTVSNRMNCLHKRFDYLDWSEGNG